MVAILPGDSQLRYDPELMLRDDSHEVFSKDYRVVPSSVAFALHKDREKDTNFASIATLEKQKLDALHSQEVTPESPKTVSRGDVFDHRPPLFSLPQNLLT